MRIPFRMIEEIFHSLDRPDEPSSIQVELRVSGSLRERELRGALGAAVAAHPMALARKASRRILLRPARWEIGGLSAGEVLRSLHCDDESALAAARAQFYSRPIDVERSPALRLLLVHRPGGDSLLLGANHAVTDGVGSLRLLHSVARAYSGRPDPVPPVDPLEARDLQAQFGHTVSGRPSNADRARPPARTRSLLVPEGADGEPGYGILLSALSVDQSRRLNPRRLVPTATINDLLLASLHRAIAIWNADRYQPCQTISVLMPVNLRPPEWRNEVVANLTLGGAILSTPEHRSTPESLLAAMTAQTRRVKAGDDFAAFLKKPLWVRKLLLTLLLARGTRSMDAAVLSNLGRIDDVPDFGAEAGEVTEFWFSPPVVMPMGLAIGAASLKGRLHLVMRYRRALFDDRVALRFSDLFLNRLTELTAGEPHDGSADPGACPPSDGSPERQRIPSS
ncbi:MAG TPA: hypothetical protein VGH33_17655 [Isosphaeraceae bacterium]